MSGSNTGWLTASGRLTIIKKYDKNSYVLGRLWLRGSTRLGPYARGSSNGALVYVSGEDERGRKAAL